MFVTTDFLALWSEHVRAKLLLREDLGISSLLLVVAHLLLFCQQTSDSDFRVQGGMSELRGVLKREKSYGQV